MAVNEKIRVRIKGYDHKLVDTAAEKIVDAAKRNGATVSGPIPLPTDKEVITILRAVHKYKERCRHRARFSRPRTLVRRHPLPGNRDAVCGEGVG